MLETLVLSTLNYDSSVASAAARMVSVALGRPIAEMGSRRTSELAAVAAARAAYIAGFDATSNLEAGRTWGIPTMGTAAHAFTLLHDTEEAAFRAQVEAFGPKTTLAHRHLRHPDRRRAGRARGRPRARRRAHRLGRPAHRGRRGARPARRARRGRHEDHRHERPRRVHDRRALGRPGRLLRRRHRGRHRLGLPGRRAWSTSSSPGATTPASGCRWRRPRAEGERRRAQERRAAARLHSHGARGAVFVGDGPERRARVRGRQRAAPLMVAAHVGRRAPTPRSSAPRAPWRRGRTAPRRCRSCRSRPSGSDAASR